MAWSTVTIGMVSSKPDDCGVSFLSRSSYKVILCRKKIFGIFHRIYRIIHRIIEEAGSCRPQNICSASKRIMLAIFTFSFQNKYSSFSWTEDETQSLYKEVRSRIRIS